MKKEQVNEVIDKFVKDGVKTETLKRMVEGLANS
jgi:polyhydroxyalkanoate synthesis regulator phasin